VRAVRRKAPFKIQFNDQHIPTAEDLYSKGKISPTTAFADVRKIENPNKYNIDEYTGNHSYGLSQEPCTHELVLAHALKSNGPTSLPLFPTISHIRKPKSIQT